MAEYQYIEYGERLRKIRKELKLSREELALEIQVSTNFYGTLEMGRSFPTSYLLVHLAKKHNVNLNYVATGEGPLFYRMTDVNEKVTNSQILESEIEILKKENKLLKELLLLRDK